MARQTQVARLIQLETGRNFTWCNQVCVDFKELAFILAKVFGSTPGAVVLGLAKQIIVQEAREEGPDLDGDNEPVRNVLPLRSRSGRPLAAIPLPPQEYAAEDLEHLAAV